MGDSPEETVPHKKPAKEIPLFQDEGSFVHETGDSYEGGYEIKKKDHSVKMNGMGTYTTAEGAKYTGLWDHDKLGAGSPVTIEFPDGAKYEGSFRDWCYAGPGQYTYPDGTVLSSNFQDNCPTGNVTILDPNGHTWSGKADAGFVWLEPVNHYYDMLDTVLKLPKKHRKKKASGEDLQQLLTQSLESQRSKTDKKMKKGGKGK